MKRFVIVVDALRFRIHPEHFDKSDNKDYVNTDTATVHVNCDRADRGSAGSCPAALWPRHEIPVPCLLRQTGIAPRLQLNVAGTQNAVPQARDRRWRRKAVRLLLALLAVPFVIIF